MGLEGRLDDLERRLAQDILALRAQVVREEKGVVSRVPGRDASPQAVKNAPMSAANMGLPVAPLPKVSGKPHHADMSANAPIAPAMQEARLGQVVRQAVEDVMSARIVSKEVATTSGEVSTQNSNTVSDVAILPWCEAFFGPAPISHLCCRRIWIKCKTRSIAWSP